MYICSGAARQRPAYGRARLTTQARGATLALPLSPFAEQLGFNPSPAAAGEAAAATLEAGALPTYRFYV